MDDDGRKDFDFFHGRWTIHNSRLNGRLRGSTDWQTFAAAGECRPILGGLGNLDSYDAAVFADGKPLRGMTLRLFDPATRLWSIYWADDRRGTLEPPVVGRFEAGVGTFAGDDRLEGRPIRVRFTWTADPTAPRWEQAFSADGGATWETNWRMVFTRAGA